MSSDPSAPVPPGPPQVAPPRLAKSAGVIGAATMTSRILGLVRDTVMAALFGAGDHMDAYLVAFRIPNLVRDLFAEGAMSAAFVPTFTRTLTLEGRERAWRLGSMVINALVLATLTVVVVGLVFASPITTAFAGKYAAVPGKLELTVMLTRIMFPFLTMVALAAAFMGMLNSLHRFFVPAFSPAMFNVGSILCTLGLVPVMPLIGLPAIVAPAIGVLVGGMLQAGVQWPSLRAEGFRYRPGLDIRDDGLRQVLVLMGPGVVGLAAVQVNLLVNTILATNEGTGAVSYLGYAFRLMYLPIGLFGVSIATASLPTLSRQAARNDLIEMRVTISRGLRMMLMLTVPATVGLIALATPIVALIFERGRFSTVDTANTAAALMFYAPGLVGYSAVKMAVPSLYALKDSRTPMMVSITTVILNLGLNIELVQVMSFRGLALGTAISAICNAAILLWVLRGRLGGLDGGRVGLAMSKIAVASALMGLAAWGTDWTIATGLPSHVLPVLALRVGASIGVGVVVLDIAARAIHIEEFMEARATVVSRLKRLRGAW